MIDAYFYHGNNMGWRESRKSFEVVDRLFGRDLQKRDYSEGYGEIWSDT